ncbi:phospho-acceptor domain-containing protein [Chitinophaga niastensis]|uniref:histidine kinase n=1 Tax=Chitinophaga niastensis TaxID=536980 RepID=A0A2P8HH10_CHINA|nr:ATP-binding protein [Chitinophaga niastensis]PSL45497.1 phospho-acceptor domain-containing protein [Chitinophaga niastensis]
MYRTQERTTFVRYAVLTTMVIILMTFFMIIFLRKRAADQLSIGVKHLVATKTDAGHIDQAVQLLYAADNNFRFYTLTYDHDYLNSYVQQLKSIAAHLDTAIASREKQQQINGLLADKEHKAQVFLQTRLFVDSLLQLSQVWDTTASPLPLQQLSNMPGLQHQQVDTIVIANTTGHKKKLFGRLKDAISNKSGVQTSQQVKIVKYGADNNNSGKAFNNAQLRRIQDAYNQFIKDATNSHNNLNKKEYALVMANERLFSGLLNLLATLKQDIVEESDKKRSQLSQDIDHSLYRIDEHSYWEIPLLLLLAGIIIYGIIRLYRYDLALLRAKQQAEKFARQKSDFVATMSHEIRTPVQSLLGYAAMLEKEKSAETVSAIRNSAEMLLQVVNNVLDYTRMESVEPVLKQEKFAPRTAIEEVSNTLQVQAEMKSLQLITNIYFPSTLLVIGDAFRLKQVLINLVANAIKFTEKGSITVTAHMRDNNLLQVNIKDTGVGISPKELPLIFDPFSQGDHNYQKGSGLGLHISKKIIDLHNGKIHVESLPGKGTTFYFEIRYQLMSPSPATKKIIVPVSNTPTAASVTAGIRLLVVEDSILNQKLLALMLDRMEASYLIVSSAEEALEVYERESFDFLLTDIDLPGMDGMVLTSIIRALPDKKKASITIIAITGNILEDDIALYLRSGLNDYIMKPYREEDIVEKITAHRQLV